MNMAAKWTKINQETLPPTKRAAHFYLRVYLQLHEWINLNSEVLKPQDWGWKLENGRYVPITTAEPPAPSDILKVIRCNCKTSSKSPCGLNSKCSCRASGLKCVVSFSQIVSNDDDGHEEFECDDENMFECIFGLCYPFSKLFSNVMIKWLRFLQFPPAKTFNSVKLARCFSYFKFILALHILWIFQVTLSIRSNFTAYLSNDIGKFHVVQRQIDIFAQKWVYFPSK